MSVIYDNLTRIVNGAILTLLLTGSSLVIGSTTGFILTVLARANRFFSAAVKAYVFLVRGTPFLVQIFIIYYGAGQIDFVRSSILWPLFRNAYFCAIFALSINSAAYCSEILRGGLASVSPGLIDAARSLGMSRLATFLLVELPLALRQAVPALGNEAVLLVKGTALASTLTLYELTGVGRQIVSETYQVYSVFIVIGAVYLAINWMVSLVFERIEFRMNRHLRR